MAKTVHLRDYLQILLRRKWIVITFLLTVFTTVTIGTFMIKPQYKSTVTIKIDKENPNILTFKDVYAVESPEEDYYQTQYKVLKSRNLAKRVIRQMKLDANPEFSGQKAEVRVASFLKKPDSLLKEEGIDSSLVDGFLRRVEVGPQQKSRLVNVSFTSFSPELSARPVTDAIAKSFIDLNIESKFEATQQARLTTVQDLGRWGHQLDGVPVAGPMDMFSHRLANHLVGNPPEAALLEITLMGPELVPDVAVTLAVCGADFDITCDGEPVYTGASFRVRPGQIIRFGRRHRGARAYMAVAGGGVRTPPLLGSRATHLVSRMGGLEGRALLAGACDSNRSGGGPTRRAGTRPDLAVTREGAPARVAGFAGRLVR